MNGKQAKRLRRMARSVQPDGTRAHVAIPTKSVRLVRREWAGLEVMEPVTQVVIVNAQGTQRAIYQSIKRRVKRMKMTKRLQFAKAKVANTASNKEAA